MNTFHSWVVSTEMGIAVKYFYGHYPVQQATVHLHGVYESTNLVLWEMEQIIVVIRVSSRDLHTSIVNSRALSQECSSGMLSNGDTANSKHSHRLWTAPAVHFTLPSTEKQIFDSCGPLIIILITTVTVALAMAYPKPLPWRLLLKNKNQKTFMHL